MKNELLRQIIIMSRTALLGLILQGIFSCMLIASDLHAQLEKKSIEDIYISLRSKNSNLSSGANLKTVLVVIEQQTGFSFAFNDKLIDLRQHIEINGNKKISLAEALREISRATNLKFRRINNYIHIGKRETPGDLEVMEEIVSAQQHTVTGTVISQVDEISLPGVTVVVQGAENLGTITDVDGKYSINVPEGGSLIFSYVGFIREEVEVGNRSVIDLVMMPDITQLEEIVVTALGIERETKALGFSAQRIGEDDLSASRETSVVSYLTGKVAGLQVSRTGTGAGGSTNVVIRGSGSIAGSNQPLYVVDGVPIINYTNDSKTAGVASLGVDRGDGIGDINPQDVESMNVLKGPAATALYGSRGANGVIVITTKSGKKGQKGLGSKLIQASHLKNCT